MVAQAARQYEQVTIIGVPMAEGAEEFIDEYELDHFAHLNNPEGEVSQRFGVSFAPAWAFVDGDTGETAVHVGALGADGLAERLEST